MFRHMPQALKHEITLPDMSIFEAKRFAQAGHPTNCKDCSTGGCYCLPYLILNHDTLFGAFKAWMEKESKTYMETLNMIAMRDDLSLLAESTYMEARKTADAVATMEEKAFLDSLEGVLHAMTDSQGRPPSSNVMEARMQKFQRFKKYVLDLETYIWWTKLSSRKNRCRSFQEASDMDGTFANSDGLGPWKLFTAFFALE